MIISPPFLPEVGDLDEAAWLDAAMAAPVSKLQDTLAPEGSFPLSRGLAWHNGVHIQAPRAAGAFLPVRAVADGRVVFVHEPTKPNADADHALNYNPFGQPPAPAWTSDGFVVIEHTTEIGAAGTTPTEIRYFSAYMHLGGLAHCPKRKAPWERGDMIHRKDELGAPGSIYGHAGQIHFEICCDEAQLRRILGRGPDASDPLEPAAPTADGRIDSVFGSIHVYLPAGTPTRSAPPVEHLRANVVATGASTPPGQVAPDTLGQAQWVSITCNKGSATVVSRDRFGQPIGAAPSETDFEYNLYAEANRRHDSLSRAMPGTPAAAGSAPPPPNSSPSGWYELLRFGRKLGPDPLPEAAAHWRRIATPQGLVWADLNAQGTFKFSDADFPHALGWHCFGDDASPTDQRCDSLHLKRLISDRDPANPHRLTTGHLVKRLGREDVRARLRRAICRFPSEWDQKDIEARYGWLRAAEENSTDDDASATRKWQRFVIHARALSFPDLPADFLKAQWRFHPREFIGVMRKCGWLSKEDLVQTLPMHAMRLVKGTYLWEQVPATNANFATNPIARDHRIPMNVALRRWAINTPTRMATFLGNSLQETMWLGRLSELGGPGLWYAPWYGRGFLQLTNPANYVAYWRYRGRQVLESLHTAMVVEYKKIAALAPSQRSNSGLQDSNFSSLNQDILRWRSEVSSDNPAKTEEDFFAPADSAGFYWAKNGMSKEADVTHALERVSISTNTGTKIYYRSPSFWRASATVNLPGAVGRTNYTGINGFDARCVAYGYALAVLTEMKFIDDDGQKSLWFPDTNLPRRAK